MALVCAVVPPAPALGAGHLLTLPLGILAAFVVMHAQGINANIMSLGGIAIAIGAMVDAAIVMIESVHKHRRIEHEPLRQSAEPLARCRRDRGEVGPALFFSLLVITLCFLPVFALEAQEGRLFKPLAFTKTYAMAAAAVLVGDPRPGADGLLHPRSHLPRSAATRSTACSSGSTGRCCARLLAAPWLDHCSPPSCWSRASLAAPHQRLGSSCRTSTRATCSTCPALPDVSVAKAREVLQQTDRLIKSVPEVEQCLHGKIGRAETATDPAPISTVRDDHPAEAARRSGGPA